MAHLPGICASNYLCLRGSLGAFQFRSFAFVSIVPELGIIIGNGDVRRGHRLRVPNFWNEIMASEKYVRAAGD